MLFHLPNGYVRYREKKHSFLCDLGLSILVFFISVAAVTLYFILLMNVFEASIPEIDPLTNSYGNWLNASAVFLFVPGVVHYLCKLASELILVIHSKRPAVHYSKPTLPRFSPSRAYFSRSTYRKASLLPVMVAELISMALFIPMIALQSIWMIPFFFWLIVCTIDLLSVFLELRALKKLPKDTLVRVRREKTRYYVIPYRLEFPE